MLRGINHWNSNEVGTTLFWPIKSKNTWSNGSTTRWELQPEESIRSGIKGKLVPNKSSFLAKTIKKWKRGRDE